MPTIRPSRDDDIDAITLIYAHHVLHGTGTFEVDPPSVQDMRARRAEVLARGLPWLIAESDNQVSGFAYCNWFKPRPAYRFSAEDSIYLAPHANGQGLGRALLAELATQAERAGVRKLIAVIGDSGNTGSIGVHRALGFQHVGVLASCGWKFDRWLDVVLMERSLGLGDTTSPQ
ncbi:MAG: N-acetyltransferase [Comamonadaceae bacterium]|jgi:L-amino acid N-acyltransferase YncA|uniref:GNAT family N-acetyltransferase n=1 Tax=Candidatus Skiveiella danica TaxID=3386177 RepID=UPI001B5D31B7|nr:N-acetyltransferase [Comamonadaceae bacterium]MBK9199736.1 N-acetyltransferase [Betaproteobacteria bacterium]MBP7966343.1 N-acetyltransferase [Burkholderiaceae bacterium]MBK6926950.1 N-acetyltransferase [Comamonadaceae bacterium]MBK8358056.1 N-acetyltransferase [Comamonadaceae bacterium]